MRGDLWTTGYAGSHTHTYSGNTGACNGENSSVTHYHTFSVTSGATGSGTAVDKMPPYIVKYCWQRTA